MCLLFKGQQYLSNNMPPFEGGREVGEFLPNKWLGYVVGTDRSEGLIWASVYIHYTLLLPSFPHLSAFTRVELCSSFHRHRRAPAQAAFLGQTSLPYRLTALPSKMWGGGELTGGTGRNGRPDFFSWQHWDQIILFHFLISPFFFMFSASIWIFLLAISALNPLNFFFFFKDNHFQHLLLFILSEWFNTCPKRSVGPGMNAAYPGHSATNQVGCGLTGPTHWKLSGYRNVRFFW